MISSFDFQSRTRAIFKEGAFELLGDLARELGFRRTLLVADPGIRATGYVDRAVWLLGENGVDVFTFHDFAENPDTRMVEHGKKSAIGFDIDSLIGLGGGSSMDCAKGINFLLSNGGCIQDYWGYGKSRQPMLPMIGIPTTAGTGSEAQSYALISDAETHAKMACGDPQAAFRTVILDPVLTLTQPYRVTAATGYDAIAHVVETFVTAKRTPISCIYSLEAWRVLECNFKKVLANGADLEARAAMQMGAYFAGVAIENSMLGAAHACANPLTARYGATHGLAIALLLPSVVRWNGSAAGDRYLELLTAAGLTQGVGTAAETLARHLENMAMNAGFPKGLKALAVSQGDLQSLSEDAARQWTGQFNPRTFAAAGALEIYEMAY